jgi:hypothetical protein
MLADIVARLRAIYPLKRGTLVGPLIDAVRLRAVARRIDGFSKKLRVLGPEEFAPYIRLLTPLSSVSAPPTDLDFDGIIVRQEWITALDRRLLTLLGSSYQCTYSNARYALFEPRRQERPETPDAAALHERIQSLVDAAPASGATIHRPRVQERAVLVTTFNRPAALRRSLPQIAALGWPMLVVDDGSDERLAHENRAICELCDARYLCAPGNRGIAAALNIGLSYLIADCRIEWISYLQDDVDVDAAAMEQLQAIEHRQERPLVTGYDAEEHATVREAEIRGVRVKLKATTPAVHLHAHTSYWWGVLPIPTGYLGAPRRGWGPPLEDDWIVRRAPASAGARGLLVACVPGLVRTFLSHPADSTWGNPTPAALERARARTARP